MLFGADPAPFKTVVGKHEITEILPNYSEGAPGEVFGILGSMGYLEIATDRGSAAKIVGVGKGSEVSDFCCKAPQRAAKQREIMRTSASQWLALSAQWRCTTRFTGGWT